MMKDDQVSNRMVNAKDSTTWYPWTTFIRRFYPAGIVEYKKGKRVVKTNEYRIDKADCTGSIISSR